VILVDTNVISELVKVEPNPAVNAYLVDLAVETVFTASVCEAEIRYGLARMPSGRKRDELIARVATFFDAGFQDQVLRFDRVCAALYGEIRQAREAVGRPMTVEDAMIAATARAYGMQAIVTRNTKDFEDCGIELIDPWRTS
jgi:predicted nucleic acid-binding protein